MHPHTFNGAARRGVLRMHSLDLYGVLADYRRDDRFHAAYEEIVDLLREVSRSDGASLDVFVPDRPINLAQAGEPYLHCAALGVHMLNACPDEPVIEASDLHAGACPPSLRATPRGWFGVPLIGREGAALGMLTGWSSSDRFSLTPMTRLLVKHLGAATVHVLDQQRRTWEQRGRPGLRVPRPGDIRQRRSDDAPPRRTNPAG